ncbi:SMI1/KNR4 family protein [Yoonia sp. 2307UL14-13]|uniref:SMI1/KNR4 family protein n=1 Tax=Yoonia sp. 2307UL14-13 TaxID=3126506 RepID=UPI0030B05630
MKIIPKTPVEPAQVDELLQGQDGATLKPYKAFLRKYGGGQVFPNSVRLDEPVNLEGPLRVFSIQSIYDPKRILKRASMDIIARDFEQPFIAIAAVSGGDEVILSLDPSDMGAIWFWSSFTTDGIHGTTRRITDSFADLLQSFAYYEDEGKTPPWNDMASVDDDPAVDLVLDL